MWRNDDVHFTSESPMFRRQMPRLEGGRGLPPFREAHPLNFLAEKISFLGQSPRPILKGRSPAQPSLELLRARAPSKAPMTLRREGRLLTPGTPENYLSVHPSIQG